MEFNRVRILDGEWLDPFIRELTAFPYVKHDDRTDAFTWALTYYTLKLDTVDKGLQDAIITNKRFLGDLTRPGMDNKNVFENLSRGIVRAPSGDTSFNDPDYDAAGGEVDSRFRFVRGGRGGYGRRGIGWDVDL